MEINKNKTIRVEIIPLLEWKLTKIRTRKTTEKNQLDQKLNCKKINKSIKILARLSRKNREDSNYKNQK